MIIEKTAAVPLIDVRGLEVAFATDAGPLKAVDGVSFSIGAGRTLGLVGESGCGKSVTALSILRLTPPPGKIVSGQVIFDGADLLGFSERRMEEVRGKRISMIFQEPMTALNPLSTIGAQVAEALLIHTTASRAEAFAAAVAMLDRVGIPDPAARAAAYPHQLSGGMRQRAMIAMALICQPGLLIADEPTTALDVTTQAQILDLMLGMQRRLGLSILFITHDLAVVSAVADEVAVMYAGRVVERSPAPALFAAPLHPYTRGLIATIPSGRPGRFRRPTGGRLPAMPGTVPDLCDLPTGCRFAERCLLADQQCKNMEPLLEEFENGRWVACWRAGHG